MQSSQLLSTRGGVNVLIYAPDLCPRKFLRDYNYVPTLSECLEFLAWYSLVHFIATALIIFI